MRKEIIQYRTVILYRDRLIYDINYESWKISKTRIDDKTVQMELSTDEEADMFLERSFNTAIGKIKENLLFCLDRFTKGGDTATNKLPMKEDTDAEVEAVTNDDADGYTVGTHEYCSGIQDGGTGGGNAGAASQESEQTPAQQQFRTHYTFGLKFSEYWRGNVEVIMTNMHNYIRCFTLSEWFALVKPDEAARYLQYADKFLSDMVGNAREESMEGVSFRL